MKATENAQLLERLAAAEHDSWARWMRWVYRVSRTNRDGTVTIPADLARRWLRQLDTPYARLSEDEKEKDREEVRRILPVIEEELGG
jgi:hypothetical protein